MSDQVRRVYKYIADFSIISGTHDGDGTFVVKLRLLGLGTVLKKWFETKEASKHFTPIITILTGRAQPLTTVVTFCSRSTLSA